MRNEKYEPIKFDSWQELVKYVTDGGEVWARNNIGQYARIVFDGKGFNCDVRGWAENTYVKKQPTLEELVSVKPRLFWVWDAHEKDKVLQLVKDVEDLPFISSDWLNHRMLSDDEIKPFLDKEPS